MKSIKQIKSDISTIGQIRSIVEVNEEIAATKMKRIRDEILESRDFLERLGDLSADIGSDLSTVGGENLKSAAVYISAERGMYGDLPEKVFISFLQHVKSQSVEAIIFGKQGKIYVQKHSPSLNYRFFEMNKESSDDENMSAITEQILDYAQVLVFYGKFRNIVNQDVASKTLLGDYMKQNMTKSEKELIKQRLKFLYEPDISTVSKKFATEIKASVLLGMMKENDLAKTASRLMHLDQAFEKIQDKLATLSILKTREDRRSEDRKQQERIKRIWA